MVILFLYRNSVRLAIRKVQYAPDKQGPQPSAEVRKDFMMSEKPLCLEASLDKEVHHVLAVIKLHSRCSVYCKPKVLFDL